MKARALLSLVSLVLAPIALNEVQAQPSPKQLRQCPDKKDGTCVEFTVRYHKNDPKKSGIPGSTNIEIVTGTGATALQRCKIGGDGSPSAPKCLSALKVDEITDVDSIQLLQTKKSDCYLVCVDGWCYEYCYP